MISLIMVPGVSTRIPVPTFRISIYMTSYKVYVKWQWKHFLGRMKSYAIVMLKQKNKDKILLQMNWLQYF